MAGPCCRTPPPFSITSGPSRAPPHRLTLRARCCRPPHVPCSSHRNRSLARSLARLGPAIIIIARRRESFDDIDECYYTFKDVYGIATMTLDATGFDEVTSSQETSKRAAAAALCLSASPCSLL